MPTTHRTATDGSPDRNLEQQLIDLLTRMEAEGTPTEGQVEQMNLLSATAIPILQAPFHTVYEPDESPQQEEADADSAPTPLPTTDPGDLQEPADALQAHLDVCPLYSPGSPRQAEPDADPFQLLPPNTTSTPQPTATDRSK